MKDIIGIQDEGQSSISIKKMALKIIAELNLPKNIHVADIGAGRGDFSKLITSLFEDITMVDFYEQPIKDSRINFINANLNDDWQISENSFDLVFALEVIEHIENPRHFVREINRILKSGGFAFISMPYNLNLFSKLNFLFKNEHRFFQDFCYPAHITCLFPKDLLRILNENNLSLIKTVYNYEDVLPLVGKNIYLPTKHFSNSVGFLIKK